MVILFTRQSRKLNRVNEVGFKLESELQHLVEENMNLMLKIDFVKSELPVGKFRIDTVGFDRDTRSFVIIEYKRDKNRSVMDQGMAYWSLLMENKAEFILAYNEKFEKSIRKDNVDWKQSRVVFIARSFTEHQKQASGFKDLSIDLYEIKNYKNGIVLFNSITVPGPNIEQPTKKGPFDNTTPKIMAIYTEIKKIMESLNDNIQIIQRKKSIIFKAEREFAWVVLRKNSINMTIKAKPDSLDDPKKIVQDVTNISHRGGGDSRIRIADVSELLYVRGLIKQAYAQNSSK